jgi:hypothetical protein
MNARTILVAAVLLAVAFLDACASSEKNDQNLVWKGNRPESPADRDSDRKSSGGTRVVTIPKDVMDQVMGFVNRPQCMIADRIEVDASRIPFQVAMVSLADPDYVQTVQLAAPKLKATGLLLRTLTEQPMVERDFARLRLGDGIDLVAGKEIQARTFSEVDPKRPAFLRIRGLGHAVYRDDENGTRLERDAITVEALVVTEKDTMVFKKRVY